MSDTSDSSSKASDQRQRAGKRFIVSFFLSLAWVLTLYLLAYRIIDPEEEYGTGIFPAPMANARVTKQARFKEYIAQHPVDGLILGSSHCMTFEPTLADRLTGHTFFNFTVENAMMEDDLAIYRWVRRQGVRPKLVVVDLDVESFAPSDQIDARLENNYELREMLSESGSPATSKVGSLLSSLKHALTIQSAVAMAKGIALKARPRPKTESIDPDGHTVFAAYERQVARGEFDLQRSVRSAISVYTDKYKSMDRLSLRRTQWLDDLVQEGSQDGCRIILWVPPFHPDLTHALAATPYAARLADLVNVENDLASKYPRSVAAFDLSSLSSFGGNDTDWIDGAHMNKENGERALKRLLSDYHGL